MPSLQVMLFKTNARQRFQQFKITLPSAVLSGTSDPAAILSGAGSTSKKVAPPSGTGWKSATPQTSRQPGGPMIGAQRAATATPTPVPPGLFLAASNDKRDVDFQSAVNAEYDKFIDQMCQAIVGGFDMWRRTAVLANVTINGPLATGGTVQAGSLGDFIKAAAPHQGLFGKASACADALATAIGDGWQDVTSAITVPGLAWYPSFAAFPGPMAPPTPNVPTPFSSLGVPMALMTAALLEQAAMQHLPSPKAFAAEQLFTAILTALQGELSRWATIQQVARVMGTGPVPSYAPPYVAAGPVTGGQVIPAPGAFAS